MFDYRQVSLRTPMALESNSWLTTNNTSTGASNRDQQQQQQQHSGVVKAREDQLGQVGQHGNQNFVTEDSQQRGLLKIPTSVIGKCSMFTQTEHTNRFTQTDHPGVRYSGNCLEPGNNSINCKAEPAAMFVPSSIQQPSANTQMYGASNEKNKETDKGSNNSATEFPFCYNVNMLQKVHQQQGNAGVPVGGISGDDKGCYRFDVAQPFGYNYALVNQMSLAAAASTATFKCDVCGLVFTHLSLLNHHKRIHNTTNVVNTGTQSTNNERQFSCDICGAGFNLAGELKSHKNGMHGKNNQNTGNKCCNSCGVELSCDHHSGGLLKAKKIGKFVKCESCPEMSSSGNVSGTSYSGSNSSGSEGNGPNPVPSSTGPVEIKPGHHPVKLRGVASVTKCHKCNGSGIIFIGGARNSTGVDKPFHCNVCDGTFSRYSSLWSHKRLHSGDKPFKCEICGLAFAKAAYLKNHGRVHTGEKPFKCAVCGMQFSQSPHLKNHERIHSGERPYQCEVCDKTFARHSTLWNHRRIHTGEKPYRCEVCGSAFNQATHLKNHAKVHTGEKPHRCDICDCGFSDRFALKRHRGIHEKYGRTSASNNSSNTANNSQSASQVAANTTNVNVNSVTNVNPVNTVSVSDVNNGNNANQNTNNPQPGMDEFMRSIHEKYGRAPTTNSSNNTTNSSPNSNQVSSNATNVNTVNVNSVGNVNPVNSVSDVNNTSNSNPNGSNPQAGMDEFMRSIHEKYGRTPASNASSNPTNNNQNTNQVAANTTNVNVNSVNVNSVNSVNPVSNVSVSDVNNRSNTNPNSNNPQTGMDELYKCEVGGPIAFPGCSRPHDEKQ